MYLEHNFDVESIEGDQMEIRGRPRDRRFARVALPKDLPIEEGDVLRLTIENHTPEHGWRLDEVHAFWYDEDKHVPDDYEFRPEHEAEIQNMMDSIIGGGE